MKKYNVLFYFLFVLLVMGALASMAQNDYGQKILGFVSYAFALTFLVELVRTLKETKERNLLFVCELIALAGIASILGCRVFYLYFTFAEYVFAICGLLLFAVYVSKAILIRRELAGMNSRYFQVKIYVLYAAIILYTFAMMITPFAPSLSEPSGKVAFALLLVGAGSFLVSRDDLFKGEKLSPYKYIASKNDNTPVLITLFVLFTGYMALTQASVLPQMYSGQLPRTYFELVSEAENGSEKPVNNKFRHELFKAKYDVFVERNSHLISQ
jgi:hypothetical protein